MNLNLVCNGQNLVFEVKRVINAGFAGRNQEKVWAHIRELEKIGVKPPSSTPTFYPLPPRSVATDEEIDVIGFSNTGEVEYVLLCSENQIFVGIGNDHTDRDLEVFSIPKSKQAYPNLLGKEVWILNEVEPHWDNLLIRSWLDQERTKLYQDGKLESLIDPSTLLNKVKDLVEGDLAGTVIYSGTIPILKEEFEFGKYFIAELIDPKREKALTCKTKFTPISWFKGELE